MPFTANCGEAVNGSIQMATCESTRCYLYSYLNEQIPDGAELARNMHLYSK
jgi:hypothetical protein